MYKHLFQKSKQVFYKENNILPSSLEIKDFKMTKKRKNSALDFGIKKRFEI